MSSRINLLNGFSSLNLRQGFRYEELDLSDGRREIMFVELIVFIVSDFRRSDDCDLETMDMITGVLENWLHPILLDNGLNLNVGL